MCLQTIMSGTDPIRALQFTYLLAPADATAAAEWETGFLELLEGRSLTHFSMVFGAQRSYQDESDRAVAADNPLVGAAVSLMIVYTTVMLGGTPPLRSRCLLGLTVVLNVGLALVVGFGLCGYLGVRYNLISFMAIFILFGIGIDDMVPTHTRILNRGVALSAECVCALCSLWCLGL